MNWLKRFVKTLPHLLMAFVMAAAVWIMAVTASDPMETKQFPNLLPIEIVGQDPTYIITSDVPTSESVTLSAPHSIWARLTTYTNPVKVMIDISGLKAGTHEVPVQIQIFVKPVRIISFEPDHVSINLEEITNKTMKITFKSTGEPAIGFRAETPTSDQDSAIITGASSLVDKVSSVEAVVDLMQARENISRTVELQALDNNGQAVSEVSITPKEVNVTQSIVALGGYRNVVVKVLWTGQIAPGYRLTNISVFPPAVTVYSENPQLVLGLPGYIETLPLDLTGTKSDFQTQLELNLPMGISAVDQSAVTVQVGISAIEGSVTVSNITVEVTGLGEGLQAQISPWTVNVILSGPLPVLDQISGADIHVRIDLTGVGVGSYQKVPEVTITKSEVQVQSVVPGTLGVIVTKSVTPTP
jgi:YbbR domain-containing protein